MRITCFGLIGLIFGIAFHPVSSLAQPWPTRTVKIVTPFPPGSGGDVTARPFADALARRWGTPVVVENRPGADGIVAVSAVLGAQDGHTILYTNGGPLTSIQLSHGSKLPYEGPLVSTSIDACRRTSAVASCNTIHGSTECGAR